VNRKDLRGNHIFSGGFLGLDNIGLFDRNFPIEGAELEQSDGTAWMAFYCVYMLKIALELADYEIETTKYDSVYQDVASKFFEHFVRIADAMNTIGGSGLWDHTKEFYLDQIVWKEKRKPMEIYSFVGLVPLFAVCNLPAKMIKKFPDFKKRTEWFIKNRPELSNQINFLKEGSESVDVCLSLVNKDKLEKNIKESIFD